MDHKAEQLDEIEALDSIYCGELNGIIFFYISRLFIIFMYNLKKLKLITIILSMN